MIYLRAPTGQSVSVKASVGQDGIRFQADAQSLLGGVPWDSAAGHVWRCSHRTGKGPLRPPGPDREGVVGGKGVVGRVEGGGGR